MKNVKFLLKVDMKCPERITQFLSLCEHAVLKKKLTQIWRVK